MAASGYGAHGDLETADIKTASIRSASRRAASVVARRRPGLVSGCGATPLSGWLLGPLPTPQTRHDLFPFAHAASLAPARSHDDQQRGFPAPTKEAARKRQTLIGGLSVTGSLVIVVSLLVYWQLAEASANEARAACEREQSALQQEISRFDLNDAGQAQQAVQRLVQSQPQWEKWPAASRFTDLLAKTRTAMEAARARQSLDEAIQQLEKQVAAHPQDAASWQAMREGAKAMAERTKNSNQEVHQRLLACLGSIEDGYLAAVRAAIAAADGDPRTARRMIAAAEDLAEAKLEAARQSRDAAAKAHWEQELSSYAKQENASLAAFYDADAIAKIACQDLLPGTSTADWVHSSSSGLAHRVDAEAIQIDGPDASAKGNGVVVLRGRAFRNC